MHGKYGDNMSPLVLHEIPVPQRIKLVEDIWDSIAADQLSIALTDEQRRTLESRLDAFEIDGDYGTEARIVMERVRKKL